MASKCISKLARSRPPSASPNSHDQVSKCISESHDHSLHVHLQTCSITASKCIPKLHDHGLQMHLQTCLITASKCISEINLISASICISKLARSRPSSASLSSLDHSLQVHLQTCSITDSKCISMLHNLGLQMHLQIRSITASKCISEFNLILASKYISTLARSWRSSASLSSLEFGLQVHLLVELHPGLQVHLQTHLIVAL